MSSTELDMSNVEVVVDEVNEVVVANIEEQEQTSEVVDNTKSELLTSLLTLLSEKMNEHGIEIGVSTIPDIVRYGMEIVEISSASKEQRKELVLEMVSKLVEDSDLPENQKNACEHVLESDMLDNLVELLIKASRGELEFNQETVEDVIEVTEDCCFAFLKLFGKKNSNNSTTTETV